MMASGVLQILYFVLSDAKPYFFVGCIFFNPCLPTDKHDLLDSSFPFRVL